MPAVSFTSVITSFVTFWQNIAISLRFPALNIPPWLSSIAENFLIFFKLLVSMIPKLPNFDIRTSLVYLSIVIPLSLDIFTIFFALPFWKAILHIFDLAAGFGFSYLLVSILIPVNFRLYPLLGSIFCLIYLIVRAIIHCVRKKEDFTIIDAAKALANFYFDGIMPNYEENMSLLEIDNKLKKSVSTIQIVAKVSSPVIIFLLYVCFLFLLLLALLLLDIIQIDIPFPAAVRLFVPYILVSLSSILFILMILKSNAPGAKFLLAIKQFLKRWGLRLLLLAFELLYIPILTGLMYNFVPIPVTCPGENLSLIHI